MQSDIHPDTESLNAFVEHALEASEREQVLAHLAECGRCRQVVFLAHEAAGTAPFEEAAVAAAQPVRSRRSWFMSWRLAWVPIAALAAFVGFAVVQHSRRVSTGTQVAKSVQNEATVAKSAPAEPAIVATPATTREVRQKTEKAPARRDSAAQVSPQNAPSPSVPMALAKPSASSLQQGSSFGSASNETAVGGSLHGSAHFSSATKNSGGPAFTDQLKKQQTEQQQTNSAQLSGFGAGRAGASPRTADAKSAMDQASVLVATPDSTTLREAAPQSMANKDSNNSIEKEALATNPKVTMLPSGLAAISVTTAAGRSVAIDPAGAMYVRQDEDKPWGPVSRQWTGRAILVTDHEYSLETRAVPLPQGSHFELVNDTFKKWLSPDGITWLPVNGPAN